MKRHKHHDIIVDWAQGKKIQMKGIEGWFDVDKPDWVDHKVYRTKPEPIPCTYRLYLYKSVCGDITVEVFNGKCDDNVQIQHLPSFIRWITEPTMVAV
jgi:hypothetical protein